MRVLYVSKASVVAAHRDKLRRLAEHVDLHVVVPSGWPGSEGPAGPEDPPTTELPVWMPGHNHFHLYRGLGPTLDRVRPTLVHVDEEPYSAVTAQAGMAAKRRGIPFLFFAAQNVPKRYPPPFHGLRRWVFRHAAAGVAGTQQAADVLVRYGFSGRLRVIPQMGVDPELFRPDPEARAKVRERLGIEPVEPVVAFLGRLVPDKAIDTLLAALAEVPNARCLVVGDGPERASLEAMARRLGMAGRTIFQDGVPSVAVPELLAGVDVLCLPSRTTPRGAEQFGRVLVEAMSCGVPVVVTECGGMPRVVGDAGAVVPEDDPPALAAALVKLVDDAEARCAAGMRGRERVLERFSQAGVVDQTVALYRDIVPGATA